MNTALEKIATPCLCGTLRKAVRHLSLAYDEAMAPLGINAGQFSLLVAVHREGGEPYAMGELAEVLVMDRSTLGHNLRPLERDGLVRFEPSPLDARRRLVVLSAKGKAVLKAGEPLWDGVNTRCKARYGAKKSEALVAALRELTLLDIAA
ncbi:MAG TPA: MarR family transcriptional regulator [Candidatus Methylacidiphilales bacterium]